MKVTGIIVGCAVILVDPLSRLIFHHNKRPQKERENCKSLFVTICARQGNSLEPYLPSALKLGEGVIFVTE